jgi:predicted O-methyltransferase YrrM
MSNYNKYVAEKNIRNSPHSDRISLWVKDSSQAAKEIPDQTLDIVFLDRGFTEAIGKQDVREWLPKVKDGGILAGHEADTPEVYNSVREELSLHGIENQSVVLSNTVWYVTVNIKNRK